jgi:hypothetical protein
VNDAGNIHQPRTAVTEKQRENPIGTPHALMIAWPDGRVAKTSRGLPMFASLTSARESATLFAGAFISALLLVSAATSLPIA